MNNNKTTIYKAQ